MTNPATDSAAVDRLIKFCVQNKADAERIFNTIAVEKKGSLTVGGESIALNQSEMGEFVQRYSAEIEPMLWESKRRKN